MPMALLLLKPEYDIFRPAEHNGTFRGNQISFVGATAAIHYFVNHRLEEEVRRKSDIVEQYLESEIQTLNPELVCRGIGLIYGIDFNKINPKMALEIVHKCFNNHLILEVAGRKDGVLKIMPPLTIEENVLREGLNILKSSILEIL